MAVSGNWAAVARGDRRPPMKVQRRATFEGEWRRRFEEFADGHEDDAGIAGWSSSGLEARLRNFMRHWRPTTSGALWIDAGCGAGTYCRFLATRSMRVIGFDYSLPSLVKARLRSPGSIWWMSGDVRRPPLASNVADGVLCFGVTQALTDSNEPIEALAEILKPNGELWVDALNAWCVPHLLYRLTRRISGRPDHMRYQSPRRMRAQFRRAGLRHIRVYWVPILPARWNRYQPMLEAAPMRWLFRVLPPVSAMMSHAFVICGVKSLRATVSKRPS